MDEKGKAVLDRIRLNTRDDYLKVNIMTRYVCEFVIVGSNQWKH